MQATTKTVIPIKEIYRSYILIHIIIVCQQSLDLFDSQLFCQLSSHFSDANIYPSLSLSDSTCRLVLIGEARAHPGLSRSYSYCERQPLRLSLNAGHIFQSSSSSVISPYIGLTHFSSYFSYVSVYITLKLFGIGEGKAQPGLSHRLPKFTHSELGGMFISFGIRGHFENLCGVFRRLPSGFEQGTLRSVATHLANIFLITY